MDMMALLMVSVCLIVSCRLLPWLRKWIVLI